MLTGTGRSSVREKKEKTQTQKRTPQPQDFAHKGEFGALDLVEDMNPL